MKKIKIGFFTGARSEYGLSKSLIKRLLRDKRFLTNVFVNGMHLSRDFGYTISEIKNDCIPIKGILRTYNKIDDNSKNFTSSVETITKLLRLQPQDAIIVAGDRIEALATCFAAYFLKIPLIHLGGGTITRGAVDNSYRYSITSMASLHLTTSQGAYKRLKKLDYIEAGNVLFTGSTAVDSIMRFKKYPNKIEKYIPNIKSGYALMTFHPVTRAKEPIAEIMNNSIKTLTTKKIKVMITYPNNDAGHKDIIKVINHWKKHPDVLVIKNLGADAYYAAINDCMFMIGNSSSGIIEAPYFNKLVINVGSRQEGREKDSCIIDTTPNIKSVNKTIKIALASKKTYKCSNLYGSGKAVDKAISSISKYFGKT